MSSVQRLEIRGIRCFGPEEAQGIEFQKPLTVICGQNGCGKTTVIECLKYVTSGALPPNSKKGQSFVHDPKMSGITEVKASIKLLFQTRTKQKAFVGKNLRLVQKKTKQEFQALDMVMKTKDPISGKTTSQSNKCTELDRMVPAFLGVSKAILENVIFCHQEDSNWPLQEGSVLKKKFDNIFESSRYTKALENIKNEKKRIAKQGKDANHQVELTKTHLERFQQLSKEIQSHNSTLKQIEGELKEKEALLVSLSGEDTSLELKLQSVETMKQKLQETDSMIQIRGKQLAEKLEVIDKDLTQVNTVSETDINADLFELLKGEVLKLTTLIEAGKKEKTSNKAEIEQLGEKMRVLDDKLLRCVEKLEKERDKMVSLETKKQEFKRKTIEFSGLISNLAMQSCSSVFLGNLREIVMASSSEGQDSIAQADMSKETLRTQILSMLDTEKSSVRQKISAVCSKRDSEFELLNKEVNELSFQLAEINASEKSQTSAKAVLRNKLGTLQKEMDAINNQSKDVAGSAEQIRKDLADARAALAEHEKGDSHISELNTELRELEDEEAILTVELSKLNEVRVDVEKHNNDVAILKAKKEELCAEVEGFRRELLSLQDGKLHNISLLQSAVDNFLSAENKEFTSFISEVSPIVSDEIQKSDAALITIKSSAQAKANQRQSISYQLMQLRGKKESALGVLDEARKEALRLEEKLPSDGSYNKLSLSSMQGARAVGSQLRIKANDLKEKLLETRIRSKLLKKFGKQIFKHGACPICSQNIGNNFVNFFETDFDVQLDFDAEHDLHISIDEASKKEHFETLWESHEDKRQKVGVVEEKVTSGRFTSFSYKKNSELSGVLAAGANALHQSQRKKHEIELLTANYEAAVEDLNEFELHKLDFLKLAELRVGKIKKLESVFLGIVEEEKECQRKQDGLRSEDREIQEKLLQCQERVQSSKDIRTYIDQFTTKARSITQLGQKLENLMLKYSRSNAAQEHRPEDFLDNIKVKERKKASIFARMKQVSKQINEYKDSLSSMSQRVIALQTSFQRFQENDKRREEILQEKVELTQRIEEASASIALFQQRRIPLERSSRSLNVKVAKVREEWSTRIKELENELRTFEMDLARLQRYHVEILSGASLEAELSLVAAQRQSWDKKCAEVRSVIKSCKEEESLRRSNASAQEKVLLDLERCYEFKQEQIEYFHQVLEKGRLVCRIESAVGHLPAVEARLEQVKREISSHKLRRERLLGQQSHVFASKDACIENLKAKQLLNIEERHSNAQIEANTLRLTETDLIKIYSALDTALVKFHNIKINEINEQIRELWNLTYKGGDIDRIAIKSDSDSIKANKTSRSYNYRVAMYKGQTELDMRGRCSAGQKVLASLVIRMALGSSFSADCGILALDEPTTNLDAENKRSLALALATIIKERGEEASFQLIIITHDDEFVEMLKQNMESGGHAVFYDVERHLNSSGKYVSKICKQV